MTSVCTPEFWARYNALPEEVRAVALKNYRLWELNPQHPSLRFKCLEDNVWSVRVGTHYRALGQVKGDQICWSWIGHHSVYDRLIR